MSICFPGTIVGRGEKTSRDFLFGIFGITKGLTLAQVREITGLDTTTIQNWINRGWVLNPVDKRYSREHLAGIIIVNMLREVMKMENIAKLLTYLEKEKGERETPNTELVISRSELYHYICDILDVIDYEVILTPSKLRNVIEVELKEYQEPFLGAKEKLGNVLNIILVYYASAIVKKEADLIFYKVIPTGN